MGSDLRTGAVAWSRTGIIEQCGPLSIFRQFGSVLRVTEKRWRSERPGGRIDGVICRRFRDSVLLGLIAFFRVGVYKWRLIPTEHRTSSQQVDRRISAPRSGIRRWLVPSGVGFASVP